MSSSPVNGNFVVRAKIGRAPAAADSHGSLHNAGRHLMFSKLVFADTNVIYTCVPWLNCTFCYCEWKVSF